MSRGRSKREHTAVQHRSRGKTRKRRVRPANPVRMADEFWRKLDSGEVASKAELARQYGYHRSRINQVLELRYLERKTFRFLLKFERLPWPRLSERFLREDNGRWGWGNTEGLPGMFLQMQYLRTGRRDVFFAVEAMARHTRDVDMRHDGRWFGRGTRHGVQHWSDGNHEERQTVHSEWRFHHYLTGEMRSRDFSEQLTERVYTRGKIYRHAAHSGRLYGLLTRWEMTGDPRLGEMLRKYLHCFIVPEGIAISPPVQFPEVELTGEPDEVNSGNMFFHTFGGMHALLEYYELSRDPELRDALIRMADHAVKQGGRPGNYRKVLAFAALEAADPTPYRRMLDDWTRSRSAYCLFNMVSDTPEHWTGETAYLRPGVSGQWFWLCDVFHVMAALDREPEPTPEQLAEFAERNAKGVPSGFARESWQSEYDRPDLAGYLRDRRKR